MTMIRARLGLRPLTPTVAGSNPSAPPNQSTHQLPLRRLSCFQWVALVRCNSQGHSQGPQFLTRKTHTETAANALDVSRFSNKHGACRSRRFRDVAIGRPKASTFRPGDGEHRIVRGRRAPMVASRRSELSTCNRESPRLGPILPSRRSPRHVVVGRTRDGDCTAAVETDVDRGEGDALTTQVGYGTATLEDQVVERRSSASFEL